MAARSSVLSHALSRHATSEPNTPLQNDDQEDADDAGSSTRATDARITVILHKDTMLPSNKISEIVYDNFEKFQNPEGYTWGKVSKELKNMYYEEFKKFFKWNEDQEKIVALRWEQSAARRYRDFIHTAKKNRAANPEAGPPLWIPEAAWDGWKAYWDSPAAVAKSQQARRNRMSEPDGPGTGISKHRGGSKCALEYAIEIAKEKGVTEEEVAADVFERLHKTNDGDYTDAKSRRIAKRIEERMQELSQPTPDTSEVPPIDRTAVFVEAVGGLDAKKRLFSANYMAKSIGQSASSSSVGDGTQNSAAEISSMKQQLASQNELIERMMAQLQAQQTRLDQLDPPQ